MAYMFCSLHKHIPQHLGSQDLGTPLQAPPSVGTRTAPGRAAQFPTGWSNLARVLRPIQTGASWSPEIPLANQALRREDFSEPALCCPEITAVVEGDHGGRGRGTTAFVEGGPRGWGGGTSPRSSTQFRPRPQGRETGAGSINLWPLGAHKHFLDITHLRPRGKADSCLSQVPRTSVSQLGPCAPWKSQGLSLATSLVDGWHGLGAC